MAQEFPKTNWLILILTFLHQQLTSKYSIPRKFVFTFLPYYYILVHSPVFVHYVHLNEILFQQLLCIT